MGKVLDRVRYDSWFVCYKTDNNNYIKVSDCEFPDKLEAIVHAREIKNLLKDKAILQFKGESQEYVLNNLVVVYKEVVKTTEVSDYMGEIAI